MPEAGQIPTPVNRDPDSNRDPLLGTTLLKRYEVIEQIGTGRFSVVYKARQLLMNRLVAIKSLKRDLLDEKEVVARFKKEARALSRLRHPNIVAVFDCFESQNGRPYLVMDYLDGMSLEDMLEKDKLINTEMAKPIFLQVCDALAHAHKQGVLHRDLKPGNMVLLAETKGNELVQLVDFGLAQVEEEVQKLTQDGECCGSPAYMSPEHCTGEPVDGRSDLYSFGVVMYEVLTGVVPFKGRTSVETMRLQVYEDAPPMVSVRPDLKIQEDVQKTVMRCLEKDPNKRYQTATQLKEDIQNWGKVARPARSLPKSLTSDRNGESSVENATPVPPVVPAAPRMARAISQPIKPTADMPSGDKLKKWTDIQQKRSALQVPIVVSCFALVLVLAVVATFKLTSSHGTSSAEPGANNTEATSSDSASRATPGSTDDLLEENPPTALTPPSQPTKPSPVSSTPSPSSSSLSSGTPDKTATASSGSTSLPSSSAHPGDNLGAATSSGFASHIGSASTPSIGVLGASSPSTSNVSAANAPIVNHPAPRATAPVSVKPTATPTPSPTKSVAPASSSFVQNTSSQPAVAPSVHPPASKPVTAPTTKPVKVTPTNNSSSATAVPTKPTSTGTEQPAAESHDAKSKAVNSAKQSPNHSEHEQAHSKRPAHKQHKHAAKSGGSESTVAAPAASTPAAPDTPPVPTHRRAYQTY